MGSGQVRPVEAKIEAICDSPVPGDRRELRRFLGMAGYYRGFCKNFATVVVPFSAVKSSSSSLRYAKRPLRMLNLCLLLLLYCWPQTLTVLLVLL